MTRTSPLITSLLSTLCGVIIVFCIWIIKDMIHRTPPDDRLDWLVMDLMLLFINIPMDVALCAVLWAFCEFLPHGAWTWQLPLWIICGAAFGLAIMNAFVYATFGAAHLPVLEPVNHSSIAGGIAFGVACVLRNRRTKSSNQAIQRTAGSPGSSL